jgi:predicted transcriptional regulator
MIKREDAILDLDSNKFKSIVTLITSVFNMSPETIFSGSRDMQVMMSRKVLIYVLDDMCWGCSRIAKHMGINHATILHHLKLKDSDLVGVPKLEEKYTRILKSARNLQNNNFEGNDDLERIQKMLTEYRELQGVIDQKTNKVKRLLDNIEVELTTSVLLNN